MAPVPLDFINSVEAFLAVLKVRFRQYGVRLGGLEKPHRSEFLLWNRQTGLSVELPWERLFKPGQIVNMSMTIHRNAYQEACPNCGSKNNAVDLSSIDYMQ